MQVSMRTGGAGGSRVTEGTATGLELGLVLHGLGVVTTAVGREADGPLIELARRVDAHGVLDQAAER